MPKAPACRSLLRFAVPFGDLALAAIAVALIGSVAATSLPPVLHNAAATVSELRRDSASAERHLWAAVEAGRRFGAHHSVATALERRASLYTAQQRYAEAERALLPLLALREARFGASHPIVADIFEELGIAAQHQGRDVDAERWFRRSLSLREASLGAQHAQTASAFLQLGSFYRGRRELRRADLYLTRSRSILEAESHTGARLVSFAAMRGRPNAEATRRRLLAAVLYELSTVRSSQSLIADASQLAQQARRLAEQGGLSPALEVAALSHLGALHHVQGDEAEAFNCYAKAQALVRLHGFEGSPLEISLSNNLAASESAASLDGGESPAHASTRRSLRERLVTEDPLAISVSWNAAVLDRHREKLHP